MSDGRKYRSDLKEHKISVKLSLAELERLDNAATSVGVSRSKYIRELINGKGNVDITFPVDRANLIRQICGVAINVNQITKLANSQGIVYDNQITELKDLLKQIQELLQGVLQQWRLRKS